MTDCLANTGFDLALPLIAAAVMLLVGIGAVLVFRRRGLRGGAALLLVLAAVGVGAVVAGGPSGSAQAAPCPVATTSSEAAPAPSTDPTPEPTPSPIETTPAATVLSAVWNPAEVSFTSNPGGPGATAALFVTNGTGAALSDLTVEITEQATGFDSVLMGSQVTGDGWSIVSGSGGGHVDLIWTGTLAPGTSTPPVALHFSTDAFNSSGSADLIATPTGGGVSGTPGVIHVSYVAPPT